jgi:WD40 repeat protein
VTSLAFSPDGRTLASGSADQHLKLWDVKSGSLLKTLLGQPDALLSLSFSPDGQSLIAAGESRSVQTWNLNLPALMQQGCERLRHYLTNHAAEAICSSNRATP